MPRVWASPKHFNTINDLSLLATNAEGTHTITDLTPGQYPLTAEIVRFRTPATLRQISRRDLIVRMDEPNTLPSECDKQCRVDGNWLALWR